MSLDAAFHLTSDQLALREEAARIAREKLRALLGEAAPGRVNRKLIRASKHPSVGIDPLSVFSE